MPSVTLGSVDVIVDPSLVTAAPKPNAVPRVNLAPNPAAGADATGWVGGARVTGQTGMTRPTGYRWTMPGGEGDAGGRATVIGGAAYTASIDLKSDYTGQCYIDVAFYNSGGTWIGSRGDQTFTVTKGVVQRRTVTVFAIVGAATGFIYVSAFGGGSVVCTAVIFEEAALAGPYFDGNTPLASWTGTPENSTSVLAGTLAATTGTCDVIVEPQPVLAEKQRDLATPNIVVEVKAVTATKTPAGPDPGTVEVVLTPGAVEVSRVLPAFATVPNVVVDPRPVVVTREVALGPPPEIVVAPAAASAGNTSPVTVQLTVTAPPVQVGFSGTLGSYSQRRIPPPLPRGGFRLMAQDILTGEWLSRELPISGPQVEWKLSGPQVITGTFEPEIRELADLDLEAWGTWIHAEEDGEIRASGILQPTTLDATGQLSIVAAGVSAYLARIPYLGTYAGVQVDPVDIVRHLWAHVQGFTRGDLGVTVLGASPVRIGDPETARVDAPEDTARVKAAKAIRARILSGLPISEDLTWAGCPAEVNNENDNLINEFRASGGSYEFTTAGLNAVAQWLATIGATANVDTPETHPYLIHGYEFPLCGKIVDDLATQAPFDYIEEQGYTDETKREVFHRIRCVYPRIGTRLPIRLVQGDNLIEHAAIDEPDEAYADSVYFQGRGEGIDAVIGFAGQDIPDRLRLPTIIQDKQVATAELATARAAESLAARLATLDEIPQIAVNVAHPNSLLATFGPGDEVIPRVTLPYRGRYEQWHRITAVSYLPDDRVATCTLTRRDQFRS